MRDHDGAHVNESACDEQISARTCWDFFQFLQPEDVRVHGPDGTFVVALSNAMPLCNPST